MTTVNRQPTTVNCQLPTDNCFRLAVKLRIAAVAGPLVDQAMLGRLTGCIQITVDFAAGRPLLIEPGIRWKEDLQ
jgi:hypothetical protein